MLTAIIILGLLGLILGFLIIFLKERILIWEEPRIKYMEKLLPGINCGLCSYPSCCEYARAILDKDEKLDLCVPGGNETMAQIEKRKK